LIPAVSLLLVAVLVVGVYVGYYSAVSTLRREGSAMISFSVGSVHARITIRQGDKVILDEYHGGAVTNLGLNFTFAKLTTNSTFYNSTQYNLNCTYVSIGDQGTLDTGSVVLPGEWNRTLASMHDCAYNSFNLTAVFYPGTGPYAADCIGVNFESGIGNKALFAYDTFTEVTGIDNTFTITVEFKISGS